MRGGINLLENLLKQFEAHSRSEQQKWQSDARCCDLRMRKPLILREDRGKRRLHSAPMSVVLRFDV